MAKANDHKSIRETMGNVWIEWWLGVRVNSNCIVLQIDFMLIMFWFNFRFYYFLEPRFVPRPAARIVASL